jgi:ribosomal protein S18 acetylase RimI-like enzyme
MEIVRMYKDHYDEVLGMMRVFYDSPAVLHTSSDQVLKNDIDACIGDNPYLDGYVFMEDNQIAGYTMVSKSFTTEYGGLCGWIEDLYIKPEYRRQGISREFFHTLPSLYPDIVRFKLEVEPENERAIATYESCSYSLLPYNIMEMVMIED